VREKMLKKDGVIFFKCISKAVNNTMTKLNKKFGKVYNCRFRDIKEKISFDWENGMIAVIFSDTKEIIACNGIENSHLMPEIFEKIKDEWVSCYIEKDVLIVQL
jgi:hypothetical protein